MPMSITHLGTGSSGNATLLVTPDVKVLIDQGFTGPQLTKRLNMLELTPTDIDCIVLSHHHGDHGGGAPISQRKWGIEVLVTQKCAAMLNLDQNLTRIFEPLDLIKIGKHLTLLPVPVPHDDAENVAFVASYGGERAAIITDLGSWTDELVRHVKGCEHISVEANYDERKLLNGPYPSTLKDRIHGRGGHLSNDQTGQFLALVCTETTRSITLTHLSRRNNLPHLAESTVLYYIDEVFQGDLRISMQDGPEFTHYIGNEHDINRLEVVPFVDESHLNSNG